MEDPVSPNVAPQSDASRHYKGEAGRRYADHHQSNPESLGYRLNVEYFLPHLRSSDVVLDFGCGNGGMMTLLSRHVKTVKGLEVNPHVAAVARQLGFHVYSDLAELPHSPTFDVVVSNHVLEHVRDPSSTLERIRAAMKPGGILLLKLPLEDWRGRDQRRWSNDDIDHHLQTWTPKLIANVLFESGFEVVDVRVVTSAWHPKLFRFLKLGLGRLAFWAFAVLKKRRQLFVQGRVPLSESAAT